MSELKGTGKYSALENGGKEDNKIKAMHATQAYDCPQRSLTDVLEIPCMTQRWVKDQLNGKRYRSYTGTTVTDTPVEIEVRILAFGAEKRG